MWCACGYVLGDAEVMACICASVLCIFSFIIFRLSCRYGFVHCVWRWASVPAGGIGWVWQKGHCFICSVGLVIVTCVPCFCACILLLREVLRYRACVQLFA